MSLSKARPVKADEMDAWKLFYVQPDGKLTSWLGQEVYREGITYRAEWSPSPERFPQEATGEAPGFHAFRDFRDASVWARNDRKLTVRRVVLSGGLRVGDSMTAGGGRAYSGQRMRVVPRG